MTVDTVSGSLVGAPRDSLLTGSSPVLTDRVMTNRVTMNPVTTTWAMTNNTNNQDRSPIRFRSEGRNDHVC